IAEFNKVLQSEPFETNTLLEETERYAAQVLAAAERCRCVMVPSWTRAPGKRGLGPIDLRPGGVGHTLALMNNCLAERLHEHASVFVVDSSTWFTGQNNPELAAKFWYAAKVPYAADVFREAARQVKALLRAVAGRSRKLLVLDLDDTLWGGIVGDVGWENLRLGGHDPVGEAFQDFQRGVKALQNRGIVLAVVSKNDEAVALEAISKHPEMLIRPNDLAGWRINWQDKAQNIAELVHELNLGMDAAVFIDDNPAERGRVAEALPELLVPDWPSDKLLYRLELDSLDCFDPAAISAEDAQRSHSYAVERERRQSRAAVSLEDWLASLQLSVKLEPLADANRQRAAQLLNKTNQMNLSTRRLTETQLQEWVDHGNGRAFWTVWVADRFGDSGLTGLVSTECGNDVCKIVDFVLSCRVFGRQVENVMAAVAVCEARRHSAGTVSATLLPTAKNRPTREFFAERSGIARAGEHEFVWDAATDYNTPDFIDVTAGSAIAKAT
ncbi:MAG: HAD-IIIC family phosphatase, partial [Gammaproteobacteria bacterium]|nr:HAD-IIIC family phosphatase [Gammaproteobacteria bacterium]